MALTKELIEEILASLPEAITIHDHERFSIQNARNTAGGLFLDIDLIDYSWIEAELEDDRGFYEEIVLYGKDPDENDEGAGLCIWGSYRRNTDIEAGQAIEAEFEGFILETNANNHQQKSEEAAARFLDLTITKKMENLQRDLIHLQGCIQSRSLYNFGDAKTYLPVDGVYALNRTIAQISAGTAS